MWELDCQESWVPKNWCFWTVVLKKTLESPLDCKEIKPVHPKGSQSWIFIGRIDAEAETPILWPPNVKIWLRKDLDAGKDWRQEKNGMTKDEMIRQHHSLNGHGFDQALWVGGRQGSLVCCHPWGLKQLDTTERLSWNKWTPIIGFMGKVFIHLKLHGCEKADLVPYTTQVSVCVWVMARITPRGINQGALSGCTNS